MSVTMRLTPVTDAPPRAVLLVDDDPSFLGSLARGLGRRDFAVTTASSVTDGRRLALAARYQVAIVDLMMADGTGLDLLRLLRREQPGADVVVLTGHGSIATAVEAMRLGAKNFLLKPIGVDELLAGLDGDTTPREHAPIHGAQLSRAEWEHIHRVLGACSGNISETARRLGIHRRSLQRKLRKYPPAG